MNEFLALTLRNVCLLLLIGFCCWLFKAWQPLFFLIFLASYKADYCPHCKRCIQDEDDK